MAANEDLIEVLNDLIEINNDRIKGYEKASEQASSIDVALQAIFRRYADQSREYAAELSKEVLRLGGNPSTDTTNMGKIYRTWMDVKATFAGDDREAILRSCEFGEDAAQKAYNMALDSDAEMNADTRQIITSQKAALKTAHDAIKNYRDIHDRANA